jgi:hypothetical protein
MVPAVLEACSRSLAGMVNLVEMLIAIRDQKMYLDSAYLPEGKIFDFRELLHPGGSSRLHCVG